MSFSWNVLLCETQTKSAAMVRADEEFMAYCQKSSSALKLLTRATSTSQTVLQARKGACE